MSKSQIPIIDIEPLRSNQVDKTKVVKGINLACRGSGFFYIVGHGIGRELQSELERLSWGFFGQPERMKLEISMSKGGRAWRGYFPVETELTSGRPDLKEGLYFGEELSPEHALVK
jgi:isopenicillin N synthase-like dioxygenase